MLHIIQHHLNNQASLLNLQAAVAAGDSILLIEDGIYSATELFKLNVICPIHALVDDVSARGLMKQIPTAIQLIDYLQFVVLTEAHAHICSW